MPKKQINITVLMPSYNSAKYLGASIKSILKQTLREFEFLIIDDGSTDNTYDVVNCFKDSRINYVKTEHRGTAAALNRGISIASGNWIARIDAGNLNVYTRLEKQAEFISANPKYDIISSWSVYFKDPGKVLLLSKEPVEHNQIYSSLNLHNPVNSSSVIYKKNIIKKFKYNEKLRRFEDYELFFRIRDEVKFYNIPVFLAYNRLKKNPPASEDDRYIIFEIINDYALKMLINSTRKRDQFYWSTVTARQNFFYGDKKDSRSYFKKVPSMKNIFSYAATYLPEGLFSKLIERKTGYRINGLFKSGKYFKNELKELLS